MTQARAKNPYLLSEIGVWAAIVSHVVILAIITIFVVLFVWPDRIALGVSAAAVIALLGTAFHVVSPFLSLLQTWRDWYLSIVVRYVTICCGLSVPAAVIFVVGICFMWPTFTKRYQYLDAVNAAIDIVDSGQLALPDPKELAKAFNRLPERPEVPLLLLRSARLLTFDDQPQNYYAYVRSFMSGVDKDAIVERYKDYKRPDKISVNRDAPSLPLLDPVQMVANFAIEEKVMEKGGPIEGFKWAITALQNHRNRDHDIELKLWRTLLQADLDLSGANQLVKDDSTTNKTVARASINAMRKKAIDDIEKQIAPTIDGDNFGKLSFAADHIYQEALDYLAWLRAEGPEVDAGLAPVCAEPDSVPALFQRILLLRGRLQSKTEIVWWRSPSKMNIYHLFLYFSGQKGKVNSPIYETFAKCPRMLARIKELYDAAAFKQFQDPEAWLTGTPLSSSLNGGASIVLLRQWTRTGW